MLHAKFQDHRTSGYGDEDFGHVTWTIYIYFRSPFQRRLQINLTLIGQAVSEEKKVNNNDDDGRRSMDIL